MLKNIRIRQQQSNKNTCRQGSSCERDQSKENQLQECKDNIGETGVTQTMNVKTLVPDEDMVAQNEIWTIRMDAV